jgi:predicted CXXCH cytochrome family protein
MFPFRYLQFALLVPAALLVLLAAPASAAAVMDCFACHERAAFDKRVKHQPAARGECSSCHNPHVAKHPGLLQQQVHKLCYSCHPGAAAEHRQGIIHGPVREGNCLGCHNPHAADHAGLLNQRGSANCFSCHSEMPRTFRFTHTPYRNGQCASCHQSHRSDQPYLLVRDQDALCLNCHTRQAVREQHANYPLPVNNCASCHNPHGSDRRALVRNVLHRSYATNCNDCHRGSAPVTVDNCLRCHEEVGKEMSSSHNHLVRYGDNSCLACHSPHAGDRAGLLKGKERYICGSCHQGTIQQAEQAAYAHPLSRPAANACGNCHALHGSNHPAMVKAPVNTVCIECHTDHELFTHPIGERVFDPRTGQMMTCASCHSSMGTSHEKHLRISGTRDLCVQCHRDH